MLTFYLNGLGFDQTHWKLGEKAGSLYPILGIGIGTSQLKVFNFRSTDLPPTDPTLDPSPGFGSENQYSIRYRFTYQALAGLEYRYNDRWVLSTGYDWLDSGRFKGPRYIRDPNGISLDAEDNEWRISFAAHEFLWAENTLIKCKGSLLSKNVCNCCKLQKKINCFLCSLLD